MAEKVWLKNVEKEDLQELWEISYGPKADLTWMAYNGPYFNDPIETWDNFSSGYGQSLVGNPMSQLIMVDHTMVGLISAYWSDSDLKQWLEIGIVLYRVDSWGKGIGSSALSQWLQILFKRFEYLPHIGFTTWSGNPGMQALGEKNKMTKEAVIRQVRFWNGQYYDSVKYGILRDEWLN